VNSQPFRGFPDKAQLVPLPNLFFTSLLPKINNLVELKVVLYLFWRFSRKRGYPKFISYRELISDKTLLKMADPVDQSTNLLEQALETAVNDSILLEINLKGEDGKRENFFFINTQANQEFIAKVKRGEISFRVGAIPEEPRPEEASDIFTLYEQNIGLLTPMIAEELKEAEKVYPASWIKEALEEAVKLNKRNWRYIARILERWASDGKDAGKFRGDTKKEKTPEYYLEGKYGHLVRH
jgi:DnaD/phage-associated family protein